MSDVDWPLVFQGAKTVLDPLSAAAWPLSLLTGLFIFRDGLRKLVGRVHTVRGGGVEVIAVAVHEDQQATAIEKAAVAVVPIPSSGDVDPPADVLFDALDNGVREVLEQHFGNDVERKFRWAVRLRTVAETNRQHETNYRLMFGSQLKALRDLNSFLRAKPAVFEPIFEAVKTDPQTAPIHADRTFAQWGEFLLSIGYVQRVEGVDPPEVEITPLGRHFLQWMTYARVSEFRPG